MPKPMRHYVAIYQFNGRPRAIDVITRHPVSAALIARENCGLPLHAVVKAAPALKAVQHA